VAGQLLCYLLLALVAAEARETWTGLRNQGSQLLSTGIGIGAAGAARDWLPTALAAARSVWPVWPVGVWPVGPVVCVCADAKTGLGIVSRSVVTCAHAVDACCQLLGLFVARRSAAAGPAASSSASSSANSPSPRQALAQLRMHESSAATPPRGRSCTLTSSDGSRSRWPACSRRRPAALQWTSGLSSRDVQRLVHYTREEPTGRGSPSPMLVMRPIPPPPPSPSSAPLLLQPGAR
jgi:hypothetical protein